MHSPIVLMTDFGTQDSYVGVMKGVIAIIAPTCPVIDLTHQIRPQDVAHGAYTLLVSVPYFPAGTIFCAVVDPGVGSARRAIAAEVGQWTLVLPDNGLLTRLLARWPATRVVTLTNAAYQLAAPSATFHGRDIFAPAAAHLAQGLPLDALGDPVPPATLHQLALPTGRRAPHRVEGQLIHIDHFGNLITDIHRDELAAGKGWHITLPAPPSAPLPALPLQRTFADVPVGDPVAYIGSDGFVEVAIRNGNAAQTWGVTVGQPVIAACA